ncbi:hypothetical protein K7X08_029029 [Anisodus acutangulus]|uniref:ZFYVE26-like TPR repeats domain-containing protein n=1 Tax=Anisodus acutangulus TaxID=402998 RepID=A0A9Q1L4D2_9SOLA|nr:hypothetical protein K7X08_029029 [Anisodus acutangulus]
MSSTFQLLTYMLVLLHHLLRERGEANSRSSLGNIKGTIDDDDWDQVLGAAINVYANKHKERPDRLIDMLTSSHRGITC